ncbi:MAG: C4-dicarboxylate ABC transporter substrate-binding protein, partial [Deltaproteobacteria bacterium]
MLRHLSVVLFLAGLLACAPPALAGSPVRLAFSGGPEGGTFNYFANGIATRLNRGMPDLFRIELKTSAGSVEN